MVFYGRINHYYLCGSSGAFLAVEKLCNDKGRLLGICSGSDDCDIIIKSSFVDELNALPNAYLNLPMVLILPAYGLNAEGNFPNALFYISFCNFRFAFILFL